MKLNKVTLAILGFLIVIFFEQCKNEKQTNDSKNPVTIKSTAKSSDPENDAFLIKTPPGYYKPYGLRPLNIIEQYDLGKSRPFSNSCPLKDKYGKLTSWDTLLHSQVPLFLQLYVNENNQLIEGVVFESNDTIQGLIMRVRIGKSGN